MTTAETTATAEILAGVQLLASHGGLVEVRVFEGKRPVAAGYFDVYHRDELARAIAQLNGATNVSVTLNPVRPEVLARSTNRLTPMRLLEAATSEADILSRTWFPVDVDSERPKGIAATDEEVQEAREVLNAVVTFLGELGFPEPIIVMSGNGWHALFRLDAVPNTPEIKLLFKRCLEALAARFSTDRAKVDQSLEDAAQLIRLPGTINVKGDPTAERPHRRARIDHFPEPLEAVPLDLLHRLAAMAPSVQRSTPTATESRAPMSRNSQESGWEQFDLVGEASARGWYIKALGGGKHAVQCPWIAEHSGDSGPTETVLWEPAAWGEPWRFKCQHAHCSGRTIRDVLEMLGLRGHAKRVVAMSPDPIEFRLYDAAVTWEFPPVAFIVDGLLPAAGVVWWGGLPKRYKSLFILYGALAIACGREWVAKHFAIRQRPKILYVSREDGGSRLQGRIDDILPAWGCGRPPAGRLRFVIRDHVNLLDEAHVAWLRDTCQREGCTLLVLDTWTALSPGADPSSAKEQAQLAAIVTQLPRTSAALWSWSTTPGKIGPKGRVSAAPTSSGPTRSGPRPSTSS